MKNLADLEKEADRLYLLHDGFHRGRQSAEATLNEMMKSYIELLYFIVDREKQSDAK